MCQRQKKMADPLMGMKVKKNGFRGEVEEIERGSISKERLYRVRYEDNDLEHFTREQVLQYRENGPAAVAGKAKAKGKPKAKGRPSQERQVIEDTPDDML